MRRNLEQRLCCATRFAAALFPVLQRAHGNTEHAGEVRLRQAELGARLGGFGHFDVEHAAGLAGLDLTHGSQQFFADVAPRSEERRVGQECVVCQCSCWWSWVLLKKKT